MKSKAFSMSKRHTIVGILQLVLGRTSIGKGILNQMNCSAGELEVVDRLLPILEELERIEVGLLLSGRRVFLLLFGMGLS